MPLVPCSRVVLASLVLAGCAGLCACSAAPRAGVPALTAREWAAMSTPGPTGVVTDAAPTASPHADAAASAAAAEGSGDNVLRDILLYIPDRIFDLLDIVRLRLRVGPGFAADIRATEAADAFAGFYSSVFVGIPGPRRAPFANWPIGYENRSGAELSVVDVASDGRSGPHYGSFEFGLGVHLGIIGLDLGIDPWEAVDFVVGIVTIDPVGDDL